MHFTSVFFLSILILIGCNGFVQGFYSDSSAVYYIRLKNASEYLAKITNRSAGQIFITDKIKGEVVLSQLDVRSIELANNNFLILVETNDKNVFFGTVTEKNGSQLILQSETLGEIIIPTIAIKSIKIIRREHIHNGEYWYPNNHASQLLLGATAIPLRKGEGRYEITDLFVNQVRYGITDNFSMMVGSVVPYTGFFSARFGKKVKPKLYLGGGATLNVALWKGLNDVNIAYFNGVMTYGNESSNLTAGLGWALFPSALAGRTSSGLAFSNATLPMTTVGAQLRVSKGTYLVTENYFFTIGNNGTIGARTRQSFLSGALRFARQKRALTLGLWVYLGQVDSGIFPHVSYARSIGKK